MKETGETVRSINSYGDVDKALLVIGKVSVAIQEAEGKLNAAMQKLREKYDSETREIVSEKEQLEHGIEQFCIANKQDFEQGRTKELTHGYIGFRVTPPSVGLLNRKYNWKTVMELLRKMKWGINFIRVKEEPDKEAILTAVAEKSLDDAKLASVGIKVDQSDKFNYDIKWESIS